MSAQNVRTAYTTDGNAIWVAGNGGNATTINSVSTPTNGVRYAVHGEVSTRPTQPRPAWGSTPLA